MEELAVTDSGALASLPLPLSPDNITVNPSGERGHSQHVEFLTRGSSKAFMTLHFADGDQQIMWAEYSGEMLISSRTTRDSAFEFKLDAANVVALPVIELRS